MKVDSELVRMTSAIDGLTVKGEAAPKNSCGIAPLSATVRINKPGNQLTPMDRSYQFVLNRTPGAEELTVTSLNGPSVPVRKMEHLSRVRTANYGMTTMDSPFVINGQPEQALVIEKPHFVLCGLPVGSKEIDHHLYVNETRVGSFKTSAKAVYQARRGQRPGKALSEQFYPFPDKDMINYNTNLPETVDETGKKSVPPIPPTTPVNYAHHLASLKPKTSQGIRTENGVQKFHGSIPSTESEKYQHSDLLIRNRKVMLHRRDESNDNVELHREHSSVSTRSGRSVETVTDSVVTNSLTVTTGKGSKIVTRSVSKSAGKVNYNNPYRNTKFRERLALSGNRRLEFNNIDSYFQYQKQQHHNGKHIMTPRAILKIPKPCSDTFLLQMMYDMNRPHAKRLAKGSAIYSDIGVTKDLEEFVQSRTSSSLSKTQSNIDKYLGKRTPKSAKSVRSAKSRKSTRSAKSALDADAIEEEGDWEEENISIVEDNKADLEKR
ncbi:uncharacterized protein LOC123552211 [Mercenaria mercenaria]|uniref:uncharacterized protein LOC123552211 n=1 Tax=Mercenaria mercenaria TaxID=6596 RepID=UPI00234ECD76|nr:uncharacterized protein LOC123552211 [Mercenaria mercenaria]